MTRAAMQRCRSRFARSCVLDRCLCLWGPSVSTLSPGPVAVAPVPSSTQVGPLRRSTDHVTAMCWETAVQWPLTVSLHGTTLWYIYMVYWVFKAKHMSRGCGHILALFYVIWHRTNFLFVYITKWPLTDDCIPSPGMDYLLAGPEDPETGRLLVTLQSVVALWTPRLGLNLSKGLRHECPWPTMLNHTQRWGLSTWSYGISGQYKDEKQVSTKHWSLCLNILPPLVAGTGCIFQSPCLLPGCVKCQYVNAPNVSLSKAWY